MVPLPLLKDTVELRRIRNLVFITHSPCRNDDWFQGRTTAKRTTLRTELIDTLLDITYHSHTCPRSFVLFSRINFAIERIFVTLQLFGTISWEGKKPIDKQRWLELYRDVEWVLLKFATLRVIDRIREAWLSMFRHGKESKARRDARSWPGSRRLAAARNLASSNQSAWLGASSLLSLQNPPMWSSRCPWISSVCHHEKCCCALRTLASNLHCHSVAFTMSFCRVDRVVYSLSSFSTLTID